MATAVETWEEADVQASEADQRQVESTQDRMHRLLAEIQHIQDQLNDTSRMRWTDAAGVVDEAAYREWRSRARYALSHFLNEYREAKALLKQEHAAQMEAKVAARRARKEAEVQAIAACGTTKDAMHELPALKLKATLEAMIEDVEVVLEPMGDRFTVRLVTGDFPDIIIYAAQVVE